MSYFLFVDPEVLKSNRTLRLDNPPLVIRDEGQNELARAHLIPIYKGELKYYREGERLKMGAHVAIVVEGPLKYEVDGEWKELP